MSLDSATRYRPKLGEEGERCSGCGVPLAEDQRYCLNCGQRRGNARVPFMDVLHEEWDAKRAREETPEADSADGPPPEGERNWSPLMSAAAGGLVALVLGIGFVIGQSGDDSSPQASAKPQVIQVGGGDANTASSSTTFASDWPADQTGWTVQLSTLPKDGTNPATIAGAKQAAENKGAAEVGALDADAFDGLDAAGNYVIYSGVFDDEKAAKARLKEVKGDFPDAKVISLGDVGDLAKKEDDSAGTSADDEGAVSKDQLNELQGLSPEEYAKKAKKLPDTTVLPGKPPPKDGKAAGGGSDSETIE